MGIGKVLFSGAQKVVNFVKKNPETALFAGAAGVGGLLLSKAITMKQDKAAEFVNHSLLINPVLNPTGCLKHILNPSDNNPNNFDMPLVKSFVDYNKSKYQDNSNLSNNNVTRLATYVIYNNNLSKVIDADDGGRIELYTNSNGRIIGSLNKDKDGKIRNININLPNGGSYNVNRSADGSFSYNSNKSVKEFYENGGKGVDFG